MYIDSADQVPLGPDELSVFGLNGLPCLLCQVLRNNKVHRIEIGLVTAGGGGGRGV